jgi:hypothetical protein
MARLSDSVECGALRADAAIEDANRAKLGGTEISIVRCRDLLGDEGCALSDEEIELIRRRAEVMAQIVVDIFLQTSPSQG